MELNPRGHNLAVITAGHELELVSLQDPEKKCSFSLASLLADSTLLLVHPKVWDPPRVHG